MIRELEGISVFCPVSGAKSPGVILDGSINLAEGIDPKGIDDRRIPPVCPHSILSQGNTPGEAVTKLERSALDGCLNSCVVAEIYRED
jgi:hypothetical protein